MTGKFKCPLCVYEQFSTHDPQKYWFHLATVHATTEKQLVKYANDEVKKSEAMRQAWIKACEEDER